MSPAASSLRVVAAVAGCAVVLCGCSREPDEPTRTVSWFQSHGEERRAMLAQCQDDPGRMSGRPNCINAIRAESLDGIGRYRDLPPLGLSPPKDADRDEAERLKIRP
jgi:hypothetical protein